ncbi:SDR family oxidoreductase [Robertmurraya korlensis]|uniref:SDR family NAD(P)-dependent oxidoreductase n=1 Tax=Robertmurraya korlensis TaxID=519977 RepID=UPI00203BB7B4|nr:SDR family oxidoreductase [Robertmurraya korlensis]MCM3603511.1 SDR family oxidoreductase [Robertmurraya korlensis]
MYSDKTVIITGGARGIGAGIAHAFYEAGAKVVIADYHAENGKQAEKKYDCERVSFFETDVSNEQSVIALVTYVMEKFGRVDILINNAGISSFSNFYEMTVEEWDRVLNTNLKGVFLCSREVAKVMEEGGAIVNISSTRAFMSEPNSEAYAASKGGIIALTHALAATLSEKKVRVNCISPGWIETNNYEELRESDHLQHFSKRVGKSSDIARGCLYLCDPNNDFINGTNITIDGGMTKKMIYEE